MLQPISAAVLAILSSSRASVRNGGHARIKEDVASTFLGSSAALGTIAGPILVPLPSNQQRSPFHRPAVSHSPQWWAHSNGGGHCPYPPPSSVRKSISAAVCVHNGRLTRMEKDIASAQYLASGVCYSFVQQSSRAVPCRATHLNGRGQYLCLPRSSAGQSVIQQCMADPLDWRKTVLLPTTVLTNIICHPVVQQRRGALHNDGPTSASATTQ